MKCIVEGCQGTTTGGNYCVLHSRRTGEPRPGISNIYKVTIKNQVFTVGVIKDGNQLLIKSARKNITKKIPRIPISIFKAKISSGNYSNIRKKKKRPSSTQGIATLNRKMAKNFSQ